MTRRGRAVRALAFLLPTLALLATVGGCVAEVGSPDPSETSSASQELTTQEISRAEIIALAQTGVGYSYFWGGDQWDPTSKSNPGKCVGSCPGCNHYGQWGADCSGYVGKVWQVPGPISLKTHSHPYTTASFRYQKTHWYPIQRSQLKRGDAMVYHAGKGGHIVLFEKWTSGGKAVSYECSGCKTGCIHGPRGFGSAYVAIRRRNVDDAPPNQPTKGWLNQAKCDVIAGWAQDPDQPKQPVSVVLTFDGPIHKKGVVKTTVKADEYRKDLCQWLGSCNHWFEIPTPAALKDGKKHTVYAYAVDSETKEHKLLSLAPKTLKCKGEAGGAGCSHEPCTEGAALGPSCSPCAKEVCLVNPDCCNPAKSWTAACVDTVETSYGACAAACAGGPSSCAHDECEAGAALTASCSACAQSVCARDGYCCSGKWDWICAKEAKDDPFCSCPE